MGIVYAPRGGWVTLLICQLVLIMDEDVLVGRCIAIALTFNSKIDYLVIVALAEIPMVTRQEVSIFRVYCLPEVPLLLVIVQEAVLLLASRFVGFFRF